MVYLQYFFPLFGCGIKFLGWVAGFTWMNKWINKEIRTYLKIERTEKYKVRTQLRWWGYLTRLPEEGLVEMFRRQEQWAKEEEDDQKEEKWYTNLWSGNNGHEVMCDIKGLKEDASKITRQKKKILYYFVLVLISCFLWPFTTHSRYKKRNLSFRNI